MISVNAEQCISNRRVNDDDDGSKYSWRRLKPITKLVIIAPVSMCISRTQFFRVVREENCGFDWKLCHSLHQIEIANRQFVSIYCFHSSCPQHDGSSFPCTGYSVSCQSGPHKVSYCTHTVKSNLFTAESVFFAFKLLNYVLRSESTVQLQFAVNWIRFSYRTLHWHFPEKLEKQQPHIVIQKIQTVDMSRPYTFSKLKYTFRLSAKTRFHRSERATFQMPVYVYPTVGAGASAAHVYFASLIRRRWFVFTFLHSFPCIQIVDRTVLLRFHCYKEKWLVRRTFVELLWHTNE